MKEVGKYISFYKKQELQKPSVFWFMENIAFLWDISRYVCVGDSDGITVNCLLLMLVWILAWIVMHIGGLWFQKELGEGRAHKGRKPLCPREWPGITLSPFPVSFSSFLAGRTVIFPQNSSEWLSFWGNKWLSQEPKILYSACYNLNMEVISISFFFSYEEISMLGLLRWESSFLVIETLMNWNTLEQVKNQN